MTFHLSTQERPRALAKSLKRLLEARGGAISLSASQAAVARMLGHRDWHGLSKSVGTADPSPDDADCDAATVAARRARSVAVVMALGYEAGVAAAVVEALHPTSVRPPAAPSGWPWTDGPAVLRSGAGAPLPFQPHSRHRSSTIDLVLGLPGSGKTTLAKAHCRALLRSVTADRPVNVAVVTVGDCYAELAEEVRSLLGDDAVAEVRMEDSPEFALNPFDTEPGCRDLSPRGREAIAAMLGILTTPDWRGAAPQVHPALAFVCVCAVYRMVSDRDPEGCPKPYEPGLRPEVDDALEAIGHDIGSATTWWAVTDALLASGNARDARIAQSHAVPVMPDFARLADRCSQSEPGSPDRRLAAPSRVLAAAADMHPMLSGPTAVDLAGKALTVVDLDKAFPTSTTGSNFPAAVALLVRNAIARPPLELRYGTSPGPWVPDLHRERHAVRLRELARTRSHLVLDEVDRFRFCGVDKFCPVAGFAEAMGSDALEFRKAGIGLLVVAQMESSFGGLDRQATGLWLSAMPGLYVRQGVGACWEAAPDLLALLDEAAAGGADVGEFIALLELGRGRQAFRISAPRGGSPSLVAADRQRWTATDPRSRPPTCA